MNVKLTRAILSLGAVLSVASAGALAAVAVDAPRFAQLGDLGVDVTLRYQVRPSDHPGGEDDTGPVLAGGTVAITAGPGRTRNVFPLASLGALAPNLPQRLPDANGGCGASGPMAIEKLDGSAYPAVVVTTVVVVKGCLPLAHVFTPLDASSTSYAPLSSYTVVHPMRLSRGEGRVVLPHLDGTLHVVRVRQIVLPNPPASDPVGIANWTIGIVDGTDAKGMPLTIGVDRPKADEMPEAGENVSLYNAKDTGLLAAIRLGADHEEAYQRLHPSPAPGSR